MELKNVDKLPIDIKEAINGSLTLVIEDLLFKGLKSLNFFVKF